MEIPVIKPKILGRVIALFVFLIFQSAQAWDLVQGPEADCPNRIFLKPSTDRNPNENFVLFEQSNIGTGPLVEFFYLNYGTFCSPLNLYAGNKCENSKADVELTHFVKTVCMAETTDEVCSPFPPSDPYAKYELTIDATTSLVHFSKLDVWGGDTTQLDCTYR